MGYFKNCYRPMFSQDEKVNFVLSLAGLIYVPAVQRRFRHYYNAETVSYSSGFKKRSVNNKPRFGRASVNKGICSNYVATPHSFFRTT